MLQDSYLLQFVAEVGLKAVTTRNPDLRYLAGKDVQQWVDQKQKKQIPRFLT
jgi:hypothetical protein